MAWLTGWDHRKEIVIPAAEVAADVTDFPVLISVGSDADIAAGAQASGNDITFRASDGTTKLDHEIEKYDSVTGQLIAHVKVPTILAASGATIYVYYGNAGATDQQNVSGVWSDGFISVHHLHEDPSGGVATDSTGNANGTFQEPSGAGTIVQAAGPYGQGYEFPGNSLDRVEFDDLDTLQGDECEIAILANADSVSHTQDWRAFTQQSGGGGADHYHMVGSLGGDDIRYRQKIDGTTQSRFGANQPLVAGNWVLLIGRFSGTSGVGVGLLFGDLTADTWSGPVDQNTGQTGVATAGTIPHRIGTGTSTSHGWDGVLKEARLGTKAHSNGWHQTWFNNVQDPATFAPLGVEENDPGGGASDISGASAGTGTATATISAYASVSGASAGVATATADITGTADVSGSAAGVGTATGTVSGLGALSGAASGTASTTGTLTATANAAGTSAGAATTTAAVAAYANAAGSAAGTSTATGSLTAGGDIAGTTAGTSTVTGTLTATGTLGGASAGLASLSATLAAWGDLAGVGAGVATSTGTLVAWANGAGASAGAATVTGQLAALGNLSGASAGAATASGTVDNAASADLSGTAAGTSTATATISAVASVSGSASGISTATADIAGLAELSGAASGTSVAAADIAGLVDASGNAAGAATAAGSLDAYANAVGTASGAASASGTVENANAGTVAGSAAGTASATATIGALANVSGSVAGTSSATATIGNANVDGAPEPEDPDIIATPFGFVEIPLWFYPYVRRLQWRIPVKISAWLSDVEREIALNEIADATKGWAQWQVVEDRPDLGGPYKLTLRAKSRSSREEREVSIEFLPIHRRTRAQFLAHLKIASDQLRL